MDRLQTRRAVRYGTDRSANTFLVDLKVIDIAWNSITLCPTEHGDKNAAI